MPHIAQDHLRLLEKRLYDQTVICLIYHSNFEVHLIFFVVLILMSNGIFGLLAVLLGLLEILLIWPRVRRNIASLAHEIAKFDRL